MDLHPTGIDPLLHNCLEPALVGNERRIPFTPDSGPFTLADRLTALGIDPADPAAVDELLLRAQELMAREGRLLTDEDLATLSGVVAARVR